MTGITTLPLAAEVIGGIISFLLLVISYILQRLGKRFDKLGDTLTEVKLELSEHLASSCERDKIINEHLIRHEGDIRDLKHTTGKHGEEIAVIKSKII
ncbi:MAG TPA: hypothetical protein P5531_04025 [Bacteroidales bacterium]|nr:hypothetical protein [Bacteroidales bacterium]